MRAAAFIAIVLLLGAAAPALAQGGSRDDRSPPRNLGEPRFDPRYGPPPGADAPFSPRQDFRPPLFDPPPRDARQKSRREPYHEPPRRDMRPPETAHRVPAPPRRPKSRVHPAPPREVARRVPPPHASRHEPRHERHHARRDERRYEPRYDGRDRRPPPRRDYDNRRDRRAYRDEPRYEPRREPGYDRRAPQGRAEHRRALLREYEHIVRRQMEIERELGGEPPRPPRDRYSEAGRHRR
jgi:hypothetical protein